VDYKFKPERNKENLLLEYSDDQLLHALGVPITNKRFKSPFRKDNRPDCQLRFSANGRIYYADYARYVPEGIDIFALVMDVYSVSFYQAVEYLWEIVDGNVEGKVIVEKEKLPKVDRFEPAKIDVQSREWLTSDLAWWAEFGIDEYTLKKYRVEPVHKIWLRDEPCYLFIKGHVHPAYVYHFGDYVKVYHPRRKEHRFLSNNGRVLQGYEQLPEKGDYLIITKSLKDVMTLSKYHIPAVAPQSESVMPDDEMMEELNRRFRKVVVLMDNDRAGKHALYLWRQKGYLITMLPIKLGAKDISDFYRRSGAWETHKLIEQAKLFYNV
jgi:hypothetical protein